MDTYGIEYDVKKVRQIERGQRTETLVPQVAKPLEGIHLMA